MCKPSWNDAPEWANWLAQDEDGEWVWFDKKPEAGALNWVAELGQEHYKHAKDGTYNPSWRATLEKRPSKERIDVTFIDSEGGCIVFEDVVKPAFNHNQDKTTRKSAISSLIEHYEIIELRDGTFYSIPSKWFEGCAIKVEIRD